MQPIDPVHPIDPMQPIDDVTLRLAEPADADRVATLFGITRRAVVPAMPPAIHTPEEDRRFFAALIDPPDYGVGPEATGQTETWLAEADGIPDPLGFAVLQPGWLHSLYVHPDAFRSGVGSALLEVAKTRLASGFSLWVFASNQPARAFYAKHGLIELEHTDGSGNEERAPDLRMAWMGADPLAFLRGLIDDVDDQLGSLLNQRAALTRAVWAHKRALDPGSPEPARDHSREHAVAQRWAANAPGLGVDRCEAIVHTVIEQSLAAARASSTPSTEV